MAWYSLNVTPNEVLRQLARPLPGLLQCALLSLPILPHSTPHLASPTQTAIEPGVSRGRFVGFCPVLCLFISALGHASLTWHPNAPLGSKCFLAIEFLAVEVSVKWRHWGFRNRASFKQLSQKLHRLRGNFMASAGRVLGYRLKQIQADSPSAASVGQATAPRLFHLPWRKPSHGSWSHSSSSKLQEPPHVGPSSARLVLIYCMWGRGWGLLGFLTLLHVPMSSCEC